MEGIKRKSQDLEDKSSISLRLEIIKTVKNKHTDGIRALCFLKDKRMVSCSEDQSIMVYHLNTFEVDIHIQNCHDYSVWSLYVLKNGNLGSSGGDEIKIWKIKGNNYKLLYTLLGHEDDVLKLIELKDNKLCSCSFREIKIWDNKCNYKCIRSLKGHDSWVNSIFEIDNYIISSAGVDQTIRIWSQSTYQTVTLMKDIYSYSANGLSKLRDNVIIVGGKSKIFIFDTLFFQVKSFEDNELGDIVCLTVLKNGKILLGCTEGIIACFEEKSNQIIFKSKVHKIGVNCLIEFEDNIFSSSYDQTINIYNLVSSEVAQI